MSYPFPTAVVSEEYPLTATTYEEKPLTPLDEDEGTAYFKKKLFDALGDVPEKFRTFSKAVDVTSEVLKKLTEDFFVPLRPLVPPYGYAPSQFLIRTHMQLKAIEEWEAKFQNREFREAFNRHTHPYSVGPTEPPAPIGTLSSPPRLGFSVGGQGYVQKDGSIKMVDSLDGTSYKARLV